MLWEGVGVLWGGCVGVLWGGCVGVRFFARVFVVVLIKIYIFGCSVSDITTSPCVLVLNYMIGLGLIVWPELNGFLYSTCMATQPQLKWVKVKFFFEGILVGILWVGILGNILIKQKEEATIFCYGRVGQ